MRCTKGILLPLLIVALLICPAQSPAQSDSDEEQPSVVTGSLWQLRNTRRMILLVRRSRVVDSRALAKSILNEALREDIDVRSRYPWLFNQLARKLNKYIKRYQSLTAVNEVSQAEFIILFNLMEFRRPLGHPYPYGEMFVILNNRASGKPPQIVWKTRKSPVWAEDAIKDFIKELKAVRGEG